MGGERENKQTSLAKKCTHMKRHTLTHPTFTAHTHTLTRIYGTMSFYRCTNQGLDFIFLFFELIFIFVCLSMEANVAQVIFVLSFVSKPVVVVLFHKWRHLLQVGCIFFLLHCWSFSHFNYIIITEWMKWKQHMYIHREEQHVKRRIHWVKDYFGWCTHTHT